MLMVEPMNKFQEKYKNSMSSEFNLNKQNIKFNKFKQQLLGEQVDILSTRINWVSIEERINKLCKQ